MRRTSAVIAGGLLITFAVARVASRLLQERQAKRQADERRRESMRQVIEHWHFRQWERDLRS